jgi:hypothetical protein
MTVIPVPGRLRQEDHKFETSPCYIERSYLEKENKKVGGGGEAGGVIQVVECLVSKGEALSSKTSTAKKKEKVDLYTNYAIKMVG